MSTTRSPFDAASATESAISPCTATKPSETRPRESSVAGRMTIPVAAVPSTNTSFTNIPGPVPRGSDTGTAHEPGGRGGVDDTRDGTIGSPALIGTSGETPVRLGIMSEPVGTALHTICSDVIACPRIRSTAAKGNGSVARSDASHAKAATTNDTAAIHRR